MKLLLLLLAGLLTACSPNVFVVDEYGTPIEGAKVYPLTRSFNWPPVTTDKEGSVHVHQDVPTIENLRVLAHGFRPSEPVSYNLPKPITIELKR